MLFKKLGSLSLALACVGNDCNIGVHNIATLVQVRQRFQERWGVDSHTGRPVESGRWQWSVSCILPGGNLQPMM